MSGMMYGYARVSTRGQKEDRHRRGENAGCLPQDLHPLGHPIAGQRGAHKAGGTAQVIRWFALLPTKRSAKIF